MLDSKQGFTAIAMQHRRMEPESARADGGGKRAGIIPGKIPSFE